MSETTKYDIPEIKTESSSESTMTTETKFIHVSDVETDSVSELDEVYIYAYSHENKEEYLKEVVKMLERDYILATAVVFPDWMEDEIDELSTEMLESVIWMQWVNEEVRKNGLQREQLEHIKEYHV